MATATTPLDSDRASPPLFIDAMRYAARWRGRNEPIQARGQAAIEVALVSGEAAGSAATATIDIGVCGSLCTLSPRKMPVTRSAAGHEEDQEA